MRILANVDTFAPVGGVELSTLQVCAALAARGHEIDVLYAEPGVLEEQWRSFVREARRVPGFTVEFATPWKQLHQLPRSVLAGVHSKPDVIYLNRAEQLLWGAVVSRLVGAPLVCHLRHHPFSPRAVALLKGSVARYIAVSDFIRREWIEAGLRPDRIDVVHNGVDPDSYVPASTLQRKLVRQRMGVDTDATVFLHYGRLTEEKGVLALLRAWIRAKTPPDWRLVLVGDVDPVVRQAVAESGRPEILLLERQDNVGDLLAMADVTVLPALWEEPFGRVVIESMAAQVPVVASRRGGIPEILSGPWDRFLFEPEDVDQTVSALHLIGQWRTRQPELGEEARSHVVDQFSLSAAVDDIESILVSCSSRR